MLKTTLFTILYSLTLSDKHIRCPTGKGLTLDDPCVIGFQQLNFDERILIDIDESIKYAIIDCNNKGCERRVSAFLGAKQTRILCDTPDACALSSFYCARGPPGSDQDEYDGDINNGVECILDADGGTSSVAKETTFVVYKNGNGYVRASGDVAFGNANYRCYSEHCHLDCGLDACTDTDISVGTIDVICTGDCSKFKARRPPLFPPIIATPDTNGDCLISDTGFTDSKTSIVFKNNCKTATLDCTNPTINCEKRKIFCAATETCNINCGGLDPSKPNEQIYLSSKCKESRVYLGPILFDLPYGTSETDYDNIKQCTTSQVTTGTGINAVINDVTTCNIVPMKSNINLIGSDSMSKGQIQSVLTDLIVNANGGKTFGEGIITCGFDNTPPDNRVGKIGSCTLNCKNDGNVKACEKCRFIERGGTFAAVGEMCIDASFRSRKGIKQQNIASINSENTILSSNNENTNNNIIIPVNGLIGFAIIFATITFIITMACCGYKKFIIGNKQDKNLLSYGAMSNEMQVVQDKA